MILNQLTLTIQWPTCSSVWAVMKQLCSHLAIERLNLLTKVDNQDC